MSAYGRFCCKSRRRDRRRASLNVGAAACCRQLQSERRLVTLRYRRPPRDLDTTRRSRNTRGGRGRRSGHELGEPAQVLGDGCQRELELGATRSAQSQAAKPQDALQVSEQHLDALAVAARLLEGLGLGECTRHVAGLLVDAAQELARRLLRTASRLEGARRAVARAGAVEQHVVVHDLAGRGEGFERRADVDVALLEEGEVLAREGAVLALGLIDHGDMRSDVLVAGIAMCSMTVLRTTAGKASKPVIKPERLAADTAYGSAANL